jgi:hypothetical protein
MTAQSRLSPRLLAATLVPLVLLAGCGRDDAADQPAAAAAPAAVVDEAAAAKVAEATRDMVAGVAVGKPNAPVDIKFELAERPEPGAPFKVRVAVLPQAAAASLTVEVTASDGLVLLDPVTPVQLDKVTGGSLQEVTVTAQAPAAGGYVLNVAVTLNDAAGGQTRAMAFPLLVGGQALPAKVSTQAKPLGAGGERAVPLKGTESGSR